MQKKSTKKLNVIYSKSCKHAQTGIAIKKQNLKMHKLSPLHETRHIWSHLNASIMLFYTSCAHHICTYIMHKIPYHCLTYGNIDEHMTRTIKSWHIQ